MKHTSDYMRTQKDLDVEGHDLTGVVVVAIGSVSCRIPAYEEEPHNKKRESTSKSKFNAFAQRNGKIMFM